MGAPKTTVFAYRETTGVGCPRLTEPRSTFSTDGRFFFHSDSSSGQLWHVRCVCVIRVGGQLIRVKKRDREKSAVHANVQRWCVVSAMAVCGNYYPWKFHSRLGNYVAVMAESPLPIRLHKCGRFFYALGVIFVCWVIYFLTFRTRPFLRFSLCCFRALSFALLMSSIRKFCFNYGCRIC